MSGDHIEIEGSVLEEKAGGFFAVALDNGQSVLASLSGRIRANKVRVIIGDKVKVRFSPYDLTRGQITYRFR